jgi:hypothetical protein
VHRAKVATAADLVAPAALIPAAQAQSAPKPPPAPEPEPDFVVACNGPTCCGPRSYGLNHKAYSVPQSQCACARMRARDQATINLLRSATITHT